MRSPTSREPVKQTKRVARMLDQQVADLGAAARQEVDHARRQARLLEQLHEARPRSPAQARGFSTTVLPVTIAAAVMPAMIASGKFHGGMITPAPSGT